MHKILKINANTGFVGSIAIPGSTPKLLLLFKVAGVRQVYYSIES